MSYTSIEQFTDEMLVDKYIALRDWLKAEHDKINQELELRLGGAQGAMATIEAELQRRLLERKATAGSTEGGTFYLSQGMRLRVADQSAFLEYVFDNRAADLIAASATKDGVRAFIEANNVAPPGVDVTYVQNLTVRRK